MHGRVGTIALALVLAGCGLFGGRQSEAEAVPKTAQTRLADRQRLQRTCASSATYDRLKVLVFDEAARIRGGRAKDLDNLAAATLVRMENPVVKGRNDALNVTVCAGRFVLELPQGAERVFGGDRRFKADVEYSAQEAVDNSGLVYQMRGAEPIVYRLSTVGLRVQSAQAASPPVTRVPTPVQTSEPAAPTIPPPAPPRAPPTIAVRPPVAPVRQIAPPPLPPRREIMARPTVPRVVRQMPQPIPEPRVASRPIPRPRIVAATVDAPQPRVASARPSFNCSVARARVERMVCADARLAAADRAMASVYYRSVATSDAQTRARLQESRGRFLAYRNRCSDDRCIEQAYADRVDEIRDLTEEQ